MKFISEKNYFEPRARLLLQLGDKLIKNENIALLELIKNSYDADAKLVKVKIENIDNKEKGIIDIIDDGEGMDIKTIENIWLEPGSDNKAQLFKTRKRTKKYRRLPIGEKGIGRFGVHKLGNQIELVTKQKDKNEVVVIINWSDFERNKYLKDAKFDVFERTPEYFIKSRTGTRITITNLRTAWDKRMIRDLYKSVFTLNSPFKKSDNFKVEIINNNPKFIIDLPTWNEIEDFSLWHFKCKIKEDEIVEFLYEFTPWQEMIGISENKFTHNDEYIQKRSNIIAKNRENPKEEITINLSRNYGDKNNIMTIGEVSFEGYIFDRDKRILELAAERKVSLIERYLNEQGGIRVYRDNIRINEYGEKGNDWLSLDLRRVNIPATRISNNIILGIIDLNLEESSALIEKTNREGFIENDAFNDFRAAILYVLHLIEKLRKDDKDLIRDKYNPTEKEEPVLYRLGELKYLIDQRIKDIPLKDEINNHLIKIEEDYNYINDVLLTSAGAGLTLAAGVHEIEKVIDEINTFLKTETNIPARINQLIKHLDELIENYSDLLKQSSSEKENVIKIIDGGIFNIEYRTKAHKIEILKNYKNYNEKFEIKCSKRLLLGAIVNIIDNSIFWLERKRKKLNSKKISFDKKILIDLEKDSKGNIDIIIADNGFGFGLPTTKIIKPFITDKPDGMGLGLHIANEALKVQNGKLYFPKYGEYELPEEFQKGAVIVLKLKQKSK